MKNIFFTFFMIPCLCFSNTHKMENEVRKLLTEIIILSSDNEDLNYLYWKGKKEGIYEVLVLLEEFNEQ